jgi:hypothetical protein
VTVELAAVLAIASAVKTAYDYYNKIGAAYSGLGVVLGAEEPPAVEDRILDELRGLKRDVDGLKGRIDQLGEQLERVLDQQRRIHLNETRRAIEETYAEARTALDELAAWVAGGRTAEGLKEQAVDHSLSAANRMRESRSLFELPNPTGTDNRFDHRLAISAYLYTLTVRLGILASVDPSFRTRAHVRAELHDHAIRLAQICDEADAKIAPAVWGSAEDGHFWWQSECRDLLSGLVNYEERSSWRPGTQADLDDVADLVRERLRWDMRNVTGLSTIMAFRDAVDYWASDPERGQWVPWFPVTPPQRRAAYDTEPVQAVCSTPGGVSLFWKVERNEVRCAFFDPRVVPARWSEPFPVVSLAAGRLLSRISAVTPGPGAVSLFFQDLEEGLSSTFFDPGGEAEWVEPFVLVPDAEYWAGEPMAAVSASPRSVSLFFLGRDRDVRSTFYDASDPAPAWVDPFSITPRGVIDPNSGLCVVTTGPRAVSLFWVGADGAVMSTYFDPAADGQWATPFPVSPAGTVTGAALGTLAAVIPREGSVSLFWVDVRERRIRSTYFDARHPRQGWALAFPVTPPRTTTWASRISAISPSPGSVSLFWVGPDGRVRSTYYDADRPEDGWVPWFPVSPPMTSMLDVTAVSTTPRGVSLFKPGVDGTISSSYFDPRG